MFSGVVRRAGLAALLACVCMGCGSGAGSDPPPPGGGMTNEQVKERLQYVADTGMTGSALSGLYEAFEKMEDKSLMKDFERLRTAPQGARTKKIAQEMIAKIK